MIPKHHIGCLIFFQVFFGIGSGISGGFLQHIITPIQSDILGYRPSR